MSSWLSVGKSYKASVPVPEMTVAVHDSADQQKAPNGAAAASNRKRSTEGEPQSDEDRHRKKHMKDKDKKGKEKKEDKKEDKKNKKSKKSKKSKKEHTHKSRSSTALVPHSFTSHNSTKPSVDIDLSSSDSEFSSSDDEAEFNSTRRIIRENRAEIMSGHSELTFLPNGEVMLLPKFATTDNTVSWNVDSRKDNNLLLFDNLPGDVVYTVNQGAKYYTSLSQLPTHNIHSTNTTYATTSAQQYRRSTQRPTGIVVPAKQLKEYEHASSLAQIFMHRTQLLSEKKRETKLGNKYRYFNTGVRSVLEDVNISRLRMRDGSASGRNGTGSVNVMLPFPYVESSVLSDLGYATGTGTTSTTEPNATSSTIDATYTTPAATAQIHCNELTRTTNTLLRTHPFDIHTILSCVYQQDSICIAQRIAGGRNYNPLHSTHNKHALALHKTITERKISILESAIANNTTHNKCILYEHLVRLLVHTKQVDKVNSVLQQAIKDCPGSVSTHILRFTHSMSVFNTSDYNTLIDSVRSVYSSVSLAAANQLAASEMNTTPNTTTQYTTTNNTGNTTHTRSLQQEYQHILLEQQLMQLQCDTLLRTLQVERSSGNVEKAVTIVQAMLDLNLSADTVPVEDYCTYWDSEHPRMGENYSVLPCLYMVGGSGGVGGVGSVSSAGGVDGSVGGSGVGGGSVGGSVGGYDNWVSSGRPAEPIESNSVNGVCDVPHYLRDDVESVRTALVGRSGDTNGTTDTTHFAHTTLATTSTTNTTTVVDTSTTNTTNTTTPSMEEQNVLAADYFLQQMLSSEHEASISHNTDTIYDPDTADMDTINSNINDSTSNNTNNNTSSTNTTSNAEPESEMVYSRLHGYKIRVTRENTGTIYKKILTDMGGTSSIDNNDSGSGSGGDSGKGDNVNSTEPTANLLATLPTHTDKVNMLSTLHTPNTTTSTTLPLPHTPYTTNAYTTYTQYRPLRATSITDSVGVEQQPERVIFASDIQNTLFRAVHSSSVSNSSIIDVAMRQKLKQMVVVRCLQSVGVVMNNVCSHSLCSRSCEVMSHSYDNVMSGEDVLLYGQMMHNLHISSAASSTNTSTTTTNTTDTTMATNLYTLLTTSDNRTLSICTITPHLLRKHKVCAKIGLDSELNFVIRLVYDVVAKGSSGGSSAGSSDSGHGCVLSAGFVTELRCVLVRLLRLRYQEEYCAQNTTTSTTDINGTINQPLLLWREQCRALIQDTIPTNTNTTTYTNTNINTTTTTTTTTTNTTTTTGTVIPAVGSLHVWAEYLQCEVLLGNVSEAVKMADKVLKSIQPTAADTENNGSAQYTGIEKFTYTVVQLALHNTYTNTTSTTTYTLTPHSIHTALALLTQFGHSYIAFNPTYGRYSGELKPLKATKGAGKNSACAAGNALNEECIVSAIENLQRNILDAVSRLQQQLLQDRRARNTTSTSTNTSTSTTNSTDSSDVAGTVDVEECSQIEYHTEIYHLVLLMVWTQYTSTLYTTAISTNTTISTALHDGAVHRGDVAFDAAIRHIKSVLFPNSDTVTSSVSNGERDATASGIEYSRFFQRFMPPTTYTSNTSTSNTISNTTNSGVAAMQYLNKAHSTSESEIGAVVLLETLHSARVHWLLSVGTANYDRNTSCGTSSNSRPQLSRSTKQLLSTALHSALTDFPLNKNLQTVFCTTNITTPGGIVHVRAYYKDIAQHRQLWGGGLQACEIINVLRVEIYSANKALLCDPLCSVRCDNVYALFDLYDVYSMCNTYDSTHNTNVTNTTSTTTNTAHPLLLCQYWSVEQTQKVRTFLETTLSSLVVASQMPLVWVYYIFLECSRGRNNEAKRVFFRAVSVCGWCQGLHVLCWGPLQCVFSDAELVSMAGMMEQRGLHGLRCGVGLTVLDCFLQR